ncbi:MAG: amidohydrolase family protein [Rhodospirillales bacterium]|jgi:hypothetical protein|nr:amidohydrolase family protein [Rhodospirillales bacterium]MDP6642770.1 amidohydrolase family protein [Rhodospirillales bacterium]
MLAEAAADHLLVNGKVLTVDDEFAIAEAIAIKGEHIAAVGTDAEIRALAGPGTKVTDVGGKTVIPGLIDNHVHYFRGVPYWRWEAFLDAVDTRQRATEIIAEKAAASAPGDWVLTIGGWDPDQFTDSSEEFTRAELDRLAPDNPAFIQHGFTGGVANSRALEILGIDSNSGFIESVSKQGWGSRYGKNSGTGIPEVIRTALPAYNEESWKADYLAKGNEDYNRAGVTTLWDAGGILYPNEFQQWAREYVEQNGGWSNLRIFANIKSDARDAADVDRLIQSIEDWPDLEDNDYFRVQGFGEMLYHPAYEVLGDLPWKESDDAYREYRRLVTAAAEKRWQIIDHAMYAEKFDWMLDMFEEIDKVHDIKPLRWSPHHCYAFTKDQFERAAELNLFLAMQTSPTLPRGPVAIYGGQDQPRMKSAQECGVKWGLGTDSKIVSPYPAFFTLYFAVTGRDVPGDIKNPTEKVSRQDALIAHTRSNAWFLFQEDNLGSIEAGKYADIAVLDRDYMTVPEDEIRDIESVLTIVGGRVGYEASQ